MRDWEPINRLKSDLSIRDWADMYTGGYRDSLARLGSFSGLKNGESPSKGSGAAGSLPADSAARKEIPIATGFFDYFPLAVAAVAEVSKKGNDQHNPGQPVHWDRSKSKDEADALLRHFMERGKLDVDGLRHSAKMAWRAMALLQKELEKFASSIGPI